VAVNTMLAGMSATLSGVLYMWIRYGKPDPSMMCKSACCGPRRHHVTLRVRESGEALSSSGPSRACSSS